jgi:hypothetical protein
MKMERQCKRYRRYCPRNTSATEKNNDDGASSESPLSGDSMTCYDRLCHGPDTHTYYFHFICDRVQSVLSENENASSDDHTCWSRAPL